MGYLGRRGGLFNSHSEVQGHGAGISLVLVKALSLNVTYPGRDMCALHTKLT